MAAELFPGASISVVGTMPQFMKMIFYIIHGQIISFCIAFLVITAILLPAGVGKMKSKPKFSQVFSKQPEINWLSAARFFLFGSRDVWFVVGLPVFLSSVLGWSHTQVGGFLALWVIGYGLVQASAPRLVRRSHHGRGPGGGRGPGFGRWGGREGRGANRCGRQTRC